MKSAIMAVKQVLFMKLMDSKKRGKSSSLTTFPPPIYPALTMGNCLESETCEDG